MSFWDNVSRWSAGRTPKPEDIGLDYKSFSTIQTVTTSQSSNGKWLGVGSAYTYTGWSSLTTVAPPPKSYPEAAAAVAGLAAGIKHALNAVMGKNGHDPERAKLYEEIMASAVKMVLAPEGSEELKGRALFCFADGAAVGWEVGELQPDQMIMQERTFYLEKRAEGECPITIYREIG